MTTTPVRKLLVAAYVLLTILAGLEAGVRIWGYSEQHIYDPIYTSFDRTGEIPYIHKPNLMDARARGLAAINTDSLGLRAKVAGASYGAKLPNEYRIAVVGDSVTFGEGVTRTSDTFAQVLEDTLNQRQPAVTVKVFNFGVSAYSVKEMAATLQYRTLATQPDLVVMAIIPPDFNLARTPMVDESGYLVDRRLSRVSPPGSMVRRVLRQIRLTYVVRDIAFGWYFAPANTAPIASRGGIPETYEYVRQFKRVAEERGQAYVITLLPSMQRGAWGHIPEQLLRDAVTHIDLSFLGREFTREQYMSSPFNYHPSAAVHHRIGESLADYVQHQPGFSR